MFASKVKESNVASDIKSAAVKAKDYSIDAASKAKDYSIEAASKAKTYSYEKSSSIQQSYNEGTLGEKAKNKASKAGSMLKSVGNSLLSNLDSFMYEG